MTRAPDPHELARRFLDLWQDQVQAMATDPEAADAMRRWTALWSGAMRPPASAAAPAAPPSGAADGLQPGYRPTAAGGYDDVPCAEPRRADEVMDEAPGEDGRRGQQHVVERPVGERRPTAAGSAAAAAVPDHGGGDLAVVLRELRRLEARIARLESRIERGG